jgi:hypothetical protein
MDAVVTALASVPVWAYAVIIIALIFAIGFQLNRIERRLDKVVDLLFLTDEIQTKAIDQDIGRSDQATLRRRAFPNPASEPAE